MPVDGFGILLFHQQLLTVDDVYSGSESWIDVLAFIDVDGADELTRRAVDAEAGRVGRLDDDVVVGTVYHHALVGDFSLRRIAVFRV